MGWKSRTVRDKGIFLPSPRTGLPWDFLMMPSGKEKRKHGVGVGRPGKRRAIRDWGRNVSVLMGPSA